MKKHKPLKVVLLTFASLLGLIVVSLAGALIFASATTLPVQDVEAMQIEGNLTRKIDKSQSLTLFTWNTGYGALDEGQDCYWDGGSGVYGESKEKVEENLSAIKAKIDEVNPDIYFLQELDLNSTRSYYIDEYEVFKNGSYETAFAKNFQAGLVPLPLYQMTGKVEAGIATFAKYEIAEATRIQLPIPFSWPMNLFNLKRCLLITRLAIEASDKQLVLINLHLEAYDDGEGKAKQLAMLMDTMQEEYNKGNYVIAGGDFNQTFSTTHLEKYPKMNDWVCPVINASSYPDFAFQMDESVPTCRSLYKVYAGADKSRFQYYMIDGFIVSKNVNINHLETLDLDFKNADHNPVSMTVTLA